MSGAGLRLAIESSYREYRRLVYLVEGDVIRILALFCQLQSTLHVSVCRVVAVGAVGTVYAVKEKETGLVIFCIKG